MNDRKQPAERFDSGEFSKQALTDITKQLEFKVEVSAGPLMMWISAAQMVFATVQTPDELKAMMDKGFADVMRQLKSAEHNNALKTIQEQALTAVQVIEAMRNEHKPEA